MDPFPLNSGAGGVHHDQWTAGWWSGLFQVVSHAALYPALYVLAQRGQWVTFTNYLGVFVASSLYHACRAGFLCLFEYRRTMMGDYFFVYRALIWSFTWLSVTPWAFPDALQRTRTRLALHNLLMLPFVLAMLDDDHSRWMQAVGAGVPLVLAVGSSVAYGRQPFRSGAWGAATVALAAVGVVLGFGLPHSEYNWAHSLWHVCSMLGMWTFVLAT